MAYQPDAYITVSRALITCLLIGGAIFSVNLAYLLFIKGIGQSGDQLEINIWGATISPGSVGTAFLAIAIVFIIAAVKSKPVFRYSSGGGKSGGSKPTGDDGPVENVVMGRRKIF